MLLLALQWGGVDYAWDSSVIIGLFVGSGVGMCLFVPWQLHMKDDALIPPRLFQAHRNVGLLCVSSFFINGPFQVIIYWLPIWFQAVRGDTPLESGVNYLPTVVSDAVTAILGSGIVMKIGWWNPFLLFANAAVCLCGGLLTTIYPSIASGHWVGYQILGGVGYSLATNLVRESSVFVLFHLYLFISDRGKKRSRRRSACKHRCHQIWFQLDHRTCSCSCLLVAQCFLL